MQNDTGLRILLNERQTLFYRWSAYLLASTLLFFGYIQIMHEPVIGPAIAAIGLAGTICIGIDIFIVTARINKLIKQLKLECYYGRLRFRMVGQILAMGFPLSFWIILLVHSTYLI